MDYTLEEFRNDMKKALLSETGADAAEITISGITLPYGERVVRLSHRAIGKLSGLMEDQEKQAIRRARGQDSDWTSDWDSP